MKAEGGRTWNITEIKTILFKTDKSQENLSKLFYNAKIIWQKMDWKRKNINFIIVLQRRLIYNVLKNNRF